ncbi:MAG: hypothetical protein WBD16_07745 [Pyrinomonadaceae bacterium]
MPNQVLEKTDNKDGFFKGAIHAVEEAAKTGVKVERLKEKATHLIEDGMIDAKRMAKRGIYAAEDLVEDTAHRIKKDPWLSVGVTFGVGMGLGVMLGWLVGHKARDN